MGSCGLQVLHFLNAIFAHAPRVRHDLVGLAIGDVNKNERRERVHVMQFWLMVPADGIDDRLGHAPACQHLRAHKSVVKRQQLLFDHPARD